MKKKLRRLWSKDELATMRKLIVGNTPTRVIALKLGRTESSIRNKARTNKLSLRPTNQSPYNRRKTKKK